MVVGREKEREREKVEKEKGKKKKEKKKRRKNEQKKIQNSSLLTCSVESVIPATCASGNALDSSLDVPPIPHPTSKILFTGGRPGSRTPDHSSILSTKSIFAPLKSLRR